MFFLPITNVYGIRRTRKTRDIARFCEKHFKKTQPTIYQRRSRMSIDSNAIFGICTFGIKVQFTREYSRETEIAWILGDWATRKL